MSRMIPRDEEQVVAEVTVRVFADHRSGIGEDEMFDIRDSIAGAMEAAASGVHSEVRKLMPDEGWRVEWEVSP